MYQVDAFGEGVFTGNPAAVVPLDDWLDDEVMLAIAAENNLAETAFVVRAKDRWKIRWFTPRIEVALCGHATLAAAHAICEFVDPDISEILFDTTWSGTLGVERNSEGYTMSFPCITPKEASTHLDLSTALGASPVRTLVGHYSESQWDIVAVFDTAESIQNIEPDFAAVAKLGSRGVICTASDHESEFVSRYFAPAVGVPEDPVTGSAHCILTPFWASEHGETDFNARQLSERGGWLRCVLDGNTVRISGRADTYLEGFISI